MNFARWERKELGKANQKKEKIRNQSFIKINSNQKQLMHQSKNNQVP